ncbi:MAG: hypothetical protein OYI31_09060 [Chloroflexota bacterium]|nr:hypothetical protein [Chloroflexota bacterium]MDE2941319.1 hypothetical protein [Chloroflexota bacterium]MDE3268581.1 hypothetical protein [Chloroflexota bacterium]
MAGLKKLGAVYLIGVAIAVAGFFVVNSFLADSIDVLDVWYVLDVLMFIALAIALPYNFARKRSECNGDPTAAVTRRYLDVNAAYYLTVGIAILFLHNWFSLLANGPESLDNNDAAWVIWAAVDVLVPIVAAVTGRRLWLEAE